MVTDLAQPLSDGCEFPDCIGFGGIEWLEQMVRTAQEPATEGRLCRFRIR